MSEPGQALLRARRMLIVEDEYLVPSDWPAHWKRTVQKSRAWRDPSRTHSHSFERKWIGWASRSSTSILARIRFIPSLGKHDSSPSTTSWQATVPGHDDGSASVRPGRSRPLRPPAICHGGVRYDTPLAGSRAMTNGAEDAEEPSPRSVRNPRS